MTEPRAPFCPFPMAMALLLCLACATTAPAPEPLAPEEPAEVQRSVLLRGASVMTAAGPTLERADLLLRGGRIEAVGTGLEAPLGAVVIDVTGRWITPGLIDPHSHLGVYPAPNVSAHSDGNESTGPLQPQLRAIESFWPQDPGIRRAVAGGVTTIHVLPGSANLIGGQGVTLRLEPRLSAREMRFPDSPASMKMACGENPKRVYGGRRKTAPSTRMAETAMLRHELRDAQRWDAKRRQEEGEDGDGDTGAVPKEAKPKLEALAGVLRGEIGIQNHCYRADEMLLRLDLFAEFGIAPRAFHHAIEAYKIRDRLAAAGVGAVVWADWWGGKMEMLDAVPAGAAMLDAAGVTVALHSDSAQDIQRLNQEAAKALAAGRRAGIEVDRDRAIRWVTANPARILGIDARAGTIEPGKDGDVVVWSADPLSVYARADLVFIAGELVYDREVPGSYPLSDFELGTWEAP